MNDEELKEFNDFLQENPVRNQFLPVFDRICKLKPKSFNVDEYVDKQEKPLIKYFLETDYGLRIDGRVCFDWCGDIKPSVKDNVIFEFWWDEECYCLYENVNQAVNWVTLILKRGNQPMYGFNTYEELKSYRKSRELIDL